MHDLEHQAERRLVGERHLADQHLEQHDAERKNVRTLIDRFAEADFGREIAWGADEFAGRGQLLREILIRQRDTEVRDLDRAATGDHQVARLDVAMDNAAVVSAGKAERGLLDHLRRLLDGQLAFALEHRTERLAFYEFHDEERLPFILANEIDLDDVRVVERSHAARLTQEALLDALVVG